LLWKAPLPFGPVVAAPALAPSGTLYAASQSGKLFALDTSGNLIWQSVSSQHKFFTPPALGDGDALYVTDDFSDLFAFAPSLGANINWKHATYSAAGASDDILLGYNQHGEGWSRTSPVIGADGIVYLAHQSWLYQLNPRGEVLWFIQLPVVQLDFPAVGGDGMVYVEGHNPPWFFAIGRDGKQRWMARASSRVMGSPVIDNAGVLYFCDSDLIKALMPDGRQIWYLFTPCNSGPALAADGTLYLGTSGPLTKNGPRQSFLSAVTPMANSNGKLKSTEWFATLPPSPPTEPSSSLPTRAMPMPFPTPALLPWTRPGRASSTTRKIPAVRPSTADILRPGLSTESRLRVPLHSKNSRRIASSTKTKPTPGTMPCTFAINR